MKEHKEDGKVLGRSEGLEPSAVYKIIEDAVKKTEYKAAWT